MSLRGFFPACLLLLALSGSVLGDTLYLKNGKSYEGKVVSDDGRVVRFKTSVGILSFDKSRIARIEKGLTRREEYARRLAKLDPGDLDGLLDLARWCRERRLPRERRMLVRRIVKACPGHPEARRALGQIWNGAK